MSVAQRDSTSQIEMLAGGQPDPGPSAGGRGKKSDLAAARAVIEGIGHPVVFHVGQFWGFTPKQGWRVCTDDVKKRVHRSKAKNGTMTIMPIIEAFVSVPDSQFHEEAPTYWERIGGMWDGRWMPFTLTKDEVLYSDCVLNVMTNEYDALENSGGAQRIIYGPRITLPFDAEGEEIRCEEFERMIDRALPDPEVRRHFQEVCSLILQPHVLLRGQIILWGPAGTGKTTIAHALACAASGMIGASFETEQQIVKNKWTAAKLVNKFVNVSDDSEVTPGWTGWVKRYSSGTLSAEVKFHQPGSFQATAKLISTCNQFQDTSDSSSAMFDRLLPFRFTERLPDITDTEKMDKAYWTKSERRAGVLSWLRDGLVRLRTRGALTPPGAWQVQKAEAVAAGDPIEGWLRENIITDTEGILKRTELLERLPADLSKRDRRFDMRLSDYMQRLFHTAVVRSREAGGEKARVYPGVRWAD